MRVVVVCAVVAAIGVACGGRTPIVHGLEELEANEVMVVLDAKGISADKLKEEGRIVTWLVQVPDVDAKEAMRILVANRLPKARSLGKNQVYAQGTGGLIPTKSEEKAKYMMAIEGDIERKLKSMPGIIQANVTVVQPDKEVIRDLDAPPPESKASVAIVFNPTDERGTATVKEEDVKNLVASAVEDLKPAGVVVVMKQNKPMNLVKIFAATDEVEQGVAAVSAYGLKFADKRSLTKVNVYGALAGGTSLLCLAVGIGGIVRSMGLKRRASKSEAELTSLRKARRETQSGLQQS